MADHDQRFKELLQEFIHEFFLLFFPDWERRLDFGKVEWLTQEVFLEPPQGERRYIDLLAKLPTREAVPEQRPGEGDRWLALIHVEIESEDSVRPQRPRMHELYGLLRRRHGLPVLPIGLYLRVGLEGVGFDVYEESLWGETLLRFRYAYVGLPALNAEDYLTRENLLGVALSALMRIEPERRAWLTAEAMRRIVDSRESDRRRHLLCDSVQAYAPMEGTAWEEFQRLLVTDPYRRLQPMVSTYLERIRQQGQDEGRRNLLRDLLQRQYGTLPAGVVERLNAWSGEQLQTLIQAFPWQGKSLRDLGLED
jgi:hypothetical protein